ncbi:MAG TPA: hypothetical protein VGR37_13665, partial [Longimicrobiaceae bacterium]|nr:hypothetical protein [Longimicrobiaceae bacterium]
REAPAGEAPARSAPAPRPAAPAADDTSLAGRLRQAESISSSSERRRALSALLREQAAQPE